MWNPTDQEVNELIQINSDTSTPERIEHYHTLAPIYFDFANDYCNQQFEVPNSNVKVFIAKAIQFYTQKAGLTARSMGSVSYSYATDLPSSVLKPLKPFKKLRW
ncbi:phage head-tail connector protein [Rummeliibacillus sp. JY-2-4R]